MYWLWKWLESNNNCILCLFNLLSYLGSLIRFAHFSIVVGEAHPPLSALTARQIFYHSKSWRTCACPKHCVSLCWNIFYHSEIWTTCACPEKQSVPWNFSLHWNVVYPSGFLSNLRLPWKTECALNSLYRISILYHSEFWPTCACSEDIVCPKIFHCIKISFLSGFLSNLPWRQRLPWKFSLYSIYFLHSGFLSICACPEKQCALNSLYWIDIFYHSEFLPTFACPENIVCPEIFTVLNILFKFRIFEQLALALKNRACPKIFHCTEMLFIFQDFLATCACPENRVCPEFFKPGGRKPPRLVRHWRHQNWTHHELISHISPFNIHICLIRQRN